MSLRAIAVPPSNGKPPQGLLVLLHGWGANAQDVAGLASMLDLPDYQMIFPDAPLPYAYAPQGRVWYNFPANYTFTSDPSFATHPELQESRQQLKTWLLSLEETTGVPLSRTILGGFSQGGAMTLEVGLGLPLAALMVLSGFFHAPVQPSAETVRNVLMVHGKQDLVVPLEAAHQARDTLLKLGVNLSYHELDMGHEISLEVLKLMQKFTEEIRRNTDVVG